MLQEIKRYTHIDSPNYGVETPQEAFNREQAYLRKKRICDELNIKDNQELNIDSIIRRLQEIIIAVNFADKQINSDNRDFILLNKVETNELKVR